MKDFQLSGDCLSLGRLEPTFSMKDFLFFLFGKDVKLSRFSFRKAAQIDDLVDGFTRQPIVSRFLREKGDLSRYPEHEDIWNLLEFDTAHVVDLRDVERPNWVFDLNHLGLAQMIGRSYDLVTDFGSLEHVFHLPNLLRNISDVCKIGGRIIHVVPCNGWVNHGFFQFSPTFFQDYYSANGFEICFMRLMRREGHWRQDFIDLIEDPFNNNLLRGNREQFLLQVCVQKVEDITTQVFPIQTMYKSPVT